MAPQTLRAQPHSPLEEVNCLAVKVDSLVVIPAVKAAENVKTDRVLVACSCNIALPEHASPVPAAKPPPEADTAAEVLPTPPWLSPHAALLQNL